MSDRKQTSVRFVDISSIQVSGKRQRRHFDETALQSLVESIASTSLLQAPVVRSIDGTLHLVAGERRMRACTDLHEFERRFKYAGVEVPPGKIPVVDLGQLSPADAYEAELEENVRRADLTWQERAAATAALAEMRRMQAEERGEAPPTVKQIAAEVRPDHTAIAGQDATRTELIVAKFLDVPEVAAAPTVKEAFKILKKKEEAKKNAELAATIGATFVSTLHDLRLGDSQEIAATLPAGTFDIILTDPPYGMGADSFGDSGLGVDGDAHKYDDSPERWEQIMGWFPAASFRLAAAQAHAYVFCDIDKFHRLRDLMSTAGWQCFRTPLIWNNLSGFRAPWPDMGPQRKSEYILFAVKGGKKVSAIYPDVISCAKELGLPHPAAKPTALLTDLLRRSALPTSKVLDLFAGSGQTIRAAHELRLPCTAVELDPTHYGYAASVIQRLSAQQELPL